MHELVNEPIDVVVEFSNGRPSPRKIRWNKRIYTVRKVNLIHAASEGQKRIYYFSVSDNATFMKLRFDTELLNWRIVEIYTD